MKDSIGRLPEEIQAYILSKLDGKSAATAKKVSRLWNEIITGLETCLHFWLRCCLKEIPTYTLVELTRLIQLSGGREKTLVEFSRDWNTSLESKLPWMFWREVYAEFIRTWYIYNGTEKKTELHYFPGHGEVSCLYEQDNVIYSGHRSGAVMSWQNIEADLHCEILYRHHRQVTSIAGLDMVMGTADILRGERGNKIVSSSTDATLKLYNIKTEEEATIKHYTKPIHCVRSWGSHFVAAADRSMIQGQPIWTVDNEPELSTKIKCTLFSQSASSLKAVAFWEDSVVTGDEMGNIFLWSGCLSCLKCDARQKNEDMQPVANLKSPVCNIYLLGHRLVCYTADHKLHISSPDGDYKFTSYDIYQTTLKTPECIAIRGSLLAIGFRSGFVYLYHVPTCQDWDQLDLALPARVIQTSQEHVNSIILGDDGGGPFVAIATEGYAITVFQFRRRKSNTKK